jgi:sodium-dependent phosphate cotransporter
MTMKEPHDPNLIGPVSPQGGYSISSLEFPLSKHETVISTEVTRAWERVHPGKIMLFIGSLFLFALAIMFLKEGARAIAPFVSNGLAVDNTANCLGFGSLFAYLIMSGSPVAATALTFFDAGMIDELGAFAMITGSRLGASFIVLFIGFLYVLRGRDRGTSLSMGLLSLAVTGATYLPALVLGACVLATGMLDRVQLGSGTLLNSAIELTVDPIVAMAAGLMPGWAIFMVGLGIVLLSFNLFDYCLPAMTLKESQMGRMSRLVYRPWVMFALGGLITLISMSVSLSLSILVPLSNRGFVRRENVVPYIMGANITTFVDTLLAAVLLNNPSAFTVVLVEMFSITVVSIVVLIISYRRYERLMLDFVARVTTSRRNLALFMGSIFVVPIILMLI